MAVLPDYVEAAGGLANVPPAPARTPDEEFAALGFFLNLDQQRLMAALQVCAAPSLVILDRCVHTLLAHRYAVERLQAIEVFEESCSLALKSPLAIWPDLLLYIDVPQPALDVRYGRDHRRPSLFTNPVYNLHFRDYFCPQPRCRPGSYLILDGTGSTRDLARVAADEIRSAAARVNKA